MKNKIYRFLSGVKIIVIKELFRRRILHRIALRIIRKLDERTIEDWLKEKIIPLRFVDEHFEYFTRYVDFMIFHLRLDNKFLLNHADYFDDDQWKHICIHQRLNMDTMRKLKDRINWKIVSRRQRMSEKFIEEFANYIDWEMLSKNEKIKFSTAFLKDYMELLNLRAVAEKQDFHYRFIEYLLQNHPLEAHMILPVVIKRKKLNENLIKTYIDEFVIYAKDVLEHQKLSTRFRNKFSNYAREYQEKIKSLFDSSDW